MLLSNILYGKETQSLRDKGVETKGSLRREDGISNSVSVDFKV